MNDPNPLFSPDGRWWWDGGAWQPAMSPDGRWRWNGHAWVQAGFRLTGRWIALIAGVVFAAVLIVTVPVVLVLNLGGSIATPVGSRSSPGSVPVTSIPCDQLEHTQVHYHAFLQILNQGQSISIPTTVGRKLGCYYWLHMHTNESGIIHVESPADQTFTVGDFFDVWSAWGGQAQRLDSTHVSTLTLTSPQKLVAYVDLGDGGGASLYSGDPRGIVLRDHEVITLEITPPAVSPPPSFSWPPGF